MQNVVNIDVSLDKKPIGTLKIPVGGAEVPRAFVNRLQGKPLEDWIRAAFMSALALTQYNGIKAAKLLKVPERTFYRKCNLMGISLKNLKEEYLLNTKLMRINRERNSEQ